MRLSDFFSLILYSVIGPFLVILFSPLWIKFIYCALILGNIAMQISEDVLQNADK